MGDETDREVAEEDRAIEGLLLGSALDVEVVIGGVVLLKDEV